MSDHRARVETPRRFIVKSAGVFWGEGTIEHTIIVRHPAGRSGSFYGAARQFTNELDRLGFTYSVDGDEEPWT